MVKESSTAYDDVFRTTVNDCPKLILPVCNELFQSGYTGNEIIVKTENEIFLHRQNGKEEKRITDTSVVIKRNAEDKGKGYHLECQSTKDGTLIIRMYEYDSQIALKNGELEEDTLTVRFPESAILYLRSDRKTPDSLWMKMETPGGIVKYPIPVMRITDYSLDMIFGKELYFILPFYIFTYEKDLKNYEKNPSMLIQLQRDFLAMRNRLQRCAEEGVMDEYTRCTLLDMSKKVVRSLLANKYPKVRKGVEEVMGGNILEYEAKTILNKGIAQGKEEGKAEGIEVGLSALVNTLRNIFPDFESVYSSIVQNEEYKSVTKEHVMKYYS